MSRESSKKTERKQQIQKKKRILVCSVAVLLIAVLAGYLVISGKIMPQKENSGDTQVYDDPAALLEQYYSYISKGKYKKMYQMLDEESRTSVSRKDFTKRNKNIYQGIEAEDISLRIIDTDIDKSGGDSAAVLYEVTMDTVAGEISFQNQTVFGKLPNTDGSGHRYGISWDDSMIFPDLTAKDRVLVSTKKADRGDIFDRKGRLLAGEGTASSVGLVPGRMNKDSSQDIAKMAEILGVTVQSIQKKLDAAWVREDSFVPVKTVEKLTDLEQMTEDPGEHVEQKMQRDAALLEIPGLLMQDTQVRQYPLGRAAAHLIGYVQQVTAEELKEHSGEGYSESSLIGKSGIESLYEKELKGRDGCEILLIDSEGRTKSRLAGIDKQDGTDIYLTIDAGLQEKIYEIFQEDKGCSVAMHPYTGEVLALVSTPSYDSNDFVLGMSEEDWDALNNDENKPIYNRFTQKQCPGSSFKPIIAAIGLKTGAVNPQEDYGNVGFSWQKDASWGSYYVTTLHTYSPVVLENALIYSDNIYFAKAALNIGQKALQKELKKLGFHKKIPFDLSMAKSQYSNSGKIESEIQLADSGYGQGQVLVNPVHLAALYTGFVNGGDVIKPFLLYRKDGQAATGGEVWLPSAFVPEQAELLKNALIQVVASEHGTGHEAYREETVLAAKTGTAEIKQTAEDEDGTELGWFAVFTADKEEKKPLLLLSMAEDVKGRGGSGYVVEKDRQILDYWFR